MFVMNWGILRSYVNVDYSEIYLISLYENKLGKINLLF